ncbi:uncharacterized protein LOC128852026 isoform X2 [Cuculus canorus]|nr:uncharacterized protein LOC128852026 isoform X2 [Cuculus canorus]XP_053921347.1 uncharacterized protein LOC128852026 isoform X2 [Cuculus canorus]
MKDNHTEITKQKLDKAAHHPIPDNQETSHSEEDYSEEEKSKSLCAFSESPKEPVTACEEQPGGDDESLKEAAVLSREKSPIAVSEATVRSSSALENELPVASDSSHLIDVEAFSNENLNRNAFNDEETNQRHKENLCQNSFLKGNNDENSIQETEGACEDYNMLRLSMENKLESYQITNELDPEAKLLSFNSEEKEISQCNNSNIHDNVPDNKTEDKGTFKGEENISSDWSSKNLLTEDLQLGFDTQVSSWSEDKFVGEQRPWEMNEPEQTCTNSSTPLNCCLSNQGLLKENHPVTVTEEADNMLSNGLSASAPCEVHSDSLVEARAGFMQCSSEVNVPINGAAPIISKGKRCRRIVNLAPKFSVPRQIAGSTEGRKEVAIKDDVPQKSVLEVEQKSFLSKDCGEECEQTHALQENFTPHSGIEATCSLPTPDADALLHDTCLHSEPSFLTPKYSCKFCVVSRTEEQARTLKQQQVVDEKESKSEQLSSEDTNSQPDILSSVVSEYPEDSSILASCGEIVHKADDPEPAEASQPEDNQDVNMKCSFLGLPLSLGFAFQLVQLFGSPGLPLESLLPDDYIVPLDWKVSKMIYLLWKTSVEEKQKSGGLQNGDAMADDIISLEDLNKNGQENQGSSEILPEMELFQGVMEENVMTSASTGCLDAVFHQS